MLLPRSELVGLLRDCERAMGEAVEAMGDLYDAIEHYERDLPQVKRLADRSRRLDDVRARVRRALSARMAV